MLTSLRHAARRTIFAARKVRLPVPPRALVLEVGSGDSPAPRSDVLLDLTLSNHERVGGRTVHDRPLVLGLVENLPFRAGVFDYLIAFHVLEHSSDPDRFLREVGRVARAGYLETPAFWVECVMPLPMHRLQVGVESVDRPGEGVPGRQRLVIRKKSATVPDPELLNQFFNRLHRGDGLFGDLPPEAWVTRYHWSGELSYRIINPEYEIRWEPPPDVTRSDDFNPRSATRKALIAMASRWGGAARRPAEQLDLIAMLRCPDCGGERLEGDLRRDRLRCPGCARDFVVTDGIPHMHPTGWRGIGGGAAEAAAATPVPAP